MTKGGNTAQRQLTLAVVVSIVVILAGSAVPWLIPSGMRSIETRLEHVQAATLFGAASLGLLSGRWTARTSLGFACAALLVLAFAGAVSGTAVGQTGLVPVMYTVGAAVAVVLLLAAAAAPEVTDSASFRRLLSRESNPVALLTLVALTPVADATLVASTALPGPMPVVFSGVIAAGWLIAAAKVLRLDRPGLRWLPAVLVILAVEAVVRSFVGVWSGSLLIAMALKALVGAFALVGAALTARAAFTTTTDGMTSMLQDLSAMQDKDSQRRAAEIERLHEVRSVLAGLRAATGSLRKYEDSLDPGIRRRLEDAVGAELSRLNHLIDPSAPEVSDALDLETVIMPVVVAEREQGLTVTTDLTGVSVHGRAAEIATLVSDLLVNARVHAPGSDVRLTARVERGMVALAVRDWGPGLSAAEAERVFERSYRGARPIAAGVPGSGLGLHNARRLARQLHGDLHVHAPAGGGCSFVATLPVAPPVAPPSPPPEEDQVIETPEPDWSSAPSLLSGTIPKPLPKSPAADAPGAPPGKPPGRAGKRSFKRQKRSPRHGQPR